MRRDQLDSGALSMTPRDLPDKTLQLPKGFRSLPLFALYEKHRRDLLMVPGISLGITLPENQDSTRNVPLAEPKSWPW
jgi:hypothetical protein